MTKTNLMKANADISKIENLLTQAQEILQEMHPDILQAFADYHNETGSIAHCLRYGMQGASEIRRDWYNVVNKIQVKEVI